MYYKKIKLTPLFIMSLVFILICSCASDDDSSKAILSSTNCVAKNIVIDEKTEIDYPIESYWQFNTVLTVRCKGEPVENAEVRVSLWWPLSDYKVITDKHGQALISESGQGDIPLGKQVTVTLFAEDGMVKKEFTVN